MAKLLQLLRITIIVLILLVSTTSVYSAQPALAQPHTVLHRLAEQQEYRLPEANLFAQVSNINQFRDVSPRNRYYKALQHLVERYGIDVALYKCPFTDVKLADCKQPIFRGNDPLLRRDFVMYLNDALDSFNNIPAAGGGDVIFSRNDVEVVASQWNDESRSIEQELTQIEARLNLLERRVYGD
ncbi:hypothetical protein [Coleofasciculus sp. FACHB-1120]|uniref:hypothetical protein n=1 Tax=Coleofasciculus sp. FACHB-1120 TaxID=2692783 RepID=UPI0016891DD2|nr:hypothetical protein [Coleofasciculus sp. FACHB-1120]MBD2740405.1 hypothetical protein [Coleofasciculus sp. FACHB-1120]